MPQLGLLAYSREDVIVLASHLERAQTRLKMMNFDSKAKRFAVMFVRDDRIRQLQTQRKTDKTWKTLLIFNYVLQVQRKYQQPIAQNEQLQLLTIHVEGASVSPQKEPKPKHQAVSLIFANDLIIRLAVECLDISMQDVEVV